MKKIDLHELVHEANRNAHDHYAERHDDIVPYIANAKTRFYYWNLIKGSIEKQGKKLKNQSVLELGCGTGTFTDLALLEGIKSFHGVDLSSKMIEKAKEKCKDPLASYFVASLEDFSITHEHQYDIIYSSSFLHHLANLDSGLKMIKKMLKPNGVYVAIHEPITLAREISWIEKLDERLQYLMGYWHEKIPLPKRIRNVIYSGIKPLIKKIIPLNSAKPRSQQGEDFVDFQLNQPFSLSSKFQASNSIEIVPYCYLAFVGLMRFSQPLNFEMLIMKNDCQ
jgi:ubiquinone/menaquinone biosynthesis C-methylase UbiE